MSSQGISPARFSKRRPIISPLRYPGGKSSLYSRLREVIRDNDLAGCRYVEPYAGGAGAGLGLLITGQVAEVVINDLDPSIHAFWRTLTEKPDWLAAQVERIAIDVPQWRKQKRIYNAVDVSKPYQLGLATLYLNRTNRSGILNGGPIGGYDQTGNYKIDARFNRAELIDRIQLLGKYAEKITVLSEDGRSVISRYADRKGTFIYADPPYFEKAGRLYLNNFTADDHAHLAKMLNRKSSAAWLLTYDAVPQVAALYPERRQYEFGLRYSARKAREATEVVVLSDSLKDLQEGWSLASERVLQEALLEA
jgi:DNA adenine methylase